jgi:hypothetical protein
MVERTVRDMRVWQSAQRNAPRTAWSGTASGAGPLWLRHIEYPLHPWTYALSRQLWRAVSHVRSNESLSLSTPLIPAQSPGILTGSFDDKFVLQVRGHLMPHLNSSGPQKDHVSRRTVGMSYRRACSLDVLQRADGGILAKFPVKVPVERRRYPAPGAAG